MTLDYCQPDDVRESINKLVFYWEPFDLRVSADRLADAGTGELWFYHCNGHGDSLLHTAKVNLLSSPSMTQLAKRMATHSTDIPWQQVLTYITARTMQYLRRGESPTTIQPVSAELHKPRYYIEPIVLKGVPNIIYGDKGVNKTTLALTAAGLLALGQYDSPCGLVPTATIRVGMLDWESDESLTAYAL